MIQAILIAIIYVLLILGLNKLFKVKYTDIIKSTENIKKGLVFPIGIATLLLTLYIAIFGSLESVFQFNPRNETLLLWIIPLLYVVGIVARLFNASWKEFDKKGIIYLVIGTALVGFSEELLVRGLIAHTLLDQGLSVLFVGLISSLIFGLLHFVNYFNGQSLKITSVQVLSTFLAGINFYVMFVISGTLWLPIIIHFLFDFSVLALGGEVNKHNKKQTTFDSILVLALYILPIIALFFL